MASTSSQSFGFFDLLTPESFAVPPRILRDNAWIGHIPFAEWLVSVLRPELLVELGTHAGVSYGAFLDAVERNRLATRCYAVDTWTGDEHSGAYGEDIFADLNAFHGPRYGGFSTLLRMTFDEALPRFDGGSVDLLHIDGYHTYEAVKHDFETWFPKLSRRSVVVFHDSNERIGDFGVFRLVEELRGRFPVFEFLHSHGLAVVGTGSELPAVLARLLSLDGPDAASIRAAYTRLGDDLLRQLERDQLRVLLDAAQATIGRQGQEIAREHDANLVAQGLLAEARSVADRQTKDIAGRDEEIERLRSGLTAALQEVQVLERNAERLAGKKHEVSAELESLRAEFAALEEEGVRSASRVAETARRSLEEERLRLARAVARIRDRSRSGLRVKWRQAREARLILASRLFDAGWYLQTYPDVHGDAYAAALHYVTRGALEGRDPNPVFDTSWYLTAYSHVAEAGFNPLVDYVRRGKAAGRDPAPDFNGARYLAVNPDVAATGVDPFLHYLLHGRGEGLSIRGGYAEWIAAYDELDDRDRVLFRNAAGRLKRQPLISVIMPVHNTDRRWLERAIESVRNQIYPNWQLCISDDASTNPSVRATLERYAALDARVRLTYRATNGHISANSNTALTLATGEFVALLDHDDELSEHALFWVAEEINRHPDVDLIYSDEDRISERGIRSEPYFKPDWNPALILSQNFFSHLGVYRRSIVELVGGFQQGFEGSQDHDLVLRCAEQTSPRRIRHIPRILYHWRSIPGSAAAGLDNKPYAWEAGARAIEDHLRRQKVPARVVRADPQYYRVEYDDLRPGKDLVSVIVPSTLNLRLIKPCLDSLLSLTAYPNFEVLLVIKAADAEAGERLAFLDSLKTDRRLRILWREDRPFNYAAVNNWAAGHAAGAVLCFLNDDVEVVTPHWLEIFVARLNLPEVGAIGPMLYYPDGRIQHAGVTLGVNGVAGHRFAGSTRQELGYFALGALEQDLSCVTAACMAVRRDAFASLAGFDERFGVAFNDVDLCLRLRRAGWRILWTPSVHHYHHESATFGSANSAERSAVFEGEVKLMHDLWGDVLHSDPFYNPNLSLASTRYEIAFPPRIAKLPVM